VLRTLLSPRFADVAPAEVVATLLDEGTYLCSERTMYRILRAARIAPLVARRPGRTPERSKPVLVARKPNEVWSWDITMLRGPRRGIHYALYVILDLFSRYVVGWTVAQREMGYLARQLIDDACARQRIRPNRLVLHSDRGTPMRSQSVADLLAALGVTRSLGRPRVSNDNPFSEAQFATLKGHADFPGRFASMDDAKAFCQRFFRWYNHEHRHGGIAMLTPGIVHRGEANKALRRRAVILDEAYRKHPERFVRRPPKPKPLHEEVGINWLPEADQNGLQRVSQTH